MLYDMWFLKLCSRKRKGSLMAAIDNLTTAVTKLTASVDNAVAVLGEPGNNEQAVQDAADAVAAQADRLDAATAGK